MYQRKFVSNKPVELLVNGYLRDVKLILISELDFINNNPYYNIPKLSVYLIIHFYQIAEYFNKFGPNVKVSDDGLSILRLETETNEWNEWNNTSYGGIKINSFHDIGTYEWTLIAQKIKLSAFVGITSNSKDLNKSIVYHNAADDQDIGYFYYFLCCFDSGLVFHPNDFYMEYGDAVGGLIDNDIISFKLFLPPITDKQNEPFIEFQVNGIHSGTLYDIIQKDDLYYTLGISLCDAFDSFKLKDFKFTPYSAYNQYKS